MPRALVRPRFIALSGGSRPLGAIGCLVALVALPIFLLPCPANLFAVRKPKKARGEQKIVSKQAGTLKVVVRQVVVDVVVTGRRGRPIKGLKKKDFEVFDDGKPQPIQAFTAHQALNLSHAVLPRLPNLPPNTFINFAHVPSNSALNVILLDLGNTPWDDLPYLRQQICKFIHKRRIEARYAVFVMGAGNVGMVQGFTSNKNRLLAAVNSKTTSSFLYQTTASPFANGMGLVNVYGAWGTGVEGSAADSHFALAEGKSVLEMPGGIPMPPPPTAAVAPEGGKRQHLLQIMAAERAPQAASRMAAAGKDIANKIQVDNTVDELDHLAAILSGLPGRKNLFWFTGSFPFHFQNFRMVSNNHGTIVNINNAPEIYRAARRLETSRTAVYAIDTKGLQVAIPTSKGVQMVQQNVGRRLYTEHLALQTVAKQTGGRAFYSTNGFAHVMGKAANEGEDYYTLAYSPSDVNFRGELRHIRVKLRNVDGKYHLYYRRTYYANSYDGTAWHPRDPLEFALQHGAPEEHQILFMASLHAIGKPQKATPAEIKELRPPSRDVHKADKRKRKKHHPLILQTYVIHYGILPKAVTAKKQHNGNRRVELEFGVRAYDKVGRELAAFSTRTQGTISRKTYRQIERKGYRVSQKIVVPVKAAFLRLAVMDRLADRVGSMEVHLPLHLASAKAERRAASR